MTVPYTLVEAKHVAERQAMDLYHRALLRWLIEEVEKLQAAQGHTVL